MPTDPPTQLEQGPLEGHLTGPDAGLGTGEIWPLASAAGRPRRQETGSGCIPVSIFRSAPGLISSSPDHRASLFSQVRLHHRVVPCSRALQSWRMPASGCAGNAESEEQPQILTRTTGSDGSTCRLAEICHIMFLARGFGWQYFRLDSAPPRDRVEWKGWYALAGSLARPHCSASRLAGEVFRKRGNDAELSFIDGNILFSRSGRFVPGPGYGSPGGCGVSRYGFV